MLILLLTIQTFFSIDLAPQLSSSPTELSLLALSESELIIWEKGISEVILLDLNTKKVKQISLSHESSSGISALTLSNDKQIYLYQDFSRYLSVYTRKLDFAYKIELPDEITTVSSIAINSRKQVFILDSDESKLSLYNIQQRKIERSISNASAYKLKFNEPNRLHFAGNELHVFDQRRVHHFSHLGEFLFSSSQPYILIKSLINKNKNYALTKSGILKLNGLAIANSVDDFILLTEYIYIIRDKRYLERLR